MARKYTMLKDSELEPKAKAGTTVYALSVWDCGLASDDSRITGVPHVSVTMDPGGGHPSFTVPRSDISPIEDVAQ